MDTQKFEIYEQLRPRIFSLLNQGIEPSHIGQLIVAWSSVEARTAYRWAAISQENYEKSSKILGGFGLFFLWIGAGILGYLVGQALSIFDSLQNPVQEILGSLGGLFLWLGLLLSIVFSRIARRF